MIRWLTKSLFILLLIVGCEITTTEHTHDSICVYKYNEPSLNSFYYTCFSNYQEADCMDKIVIFNEESNEAVEWFSNITCEEFCPQNTTVCNISTDKP